MTDRSRFPDGFRRDLIEQLFTGNGTVDLTRGDGLVRFDIPAGTWNLTLPDPLYEGQLLVFQAGTDAGGAVVVTTVNAFFNANDDYIATFSAAGGVFSVVGTSFNAGSTLYPIWRQVILDSVILSG